MLLMMLSRFITLIFLIGFVSAVEVDFNCPDKIYVDEDFGCSVEVSDGDGVYDVKVDLDGERNSVLDFWTGDEWKSGYYYFKDFIEDGDEEILKLKVSEVGRYDGILKLRQGNKREFFDVEIRVRETRVNDDVVDDTPSKKSEVILLNNVNPEIISLNALDSEDEWDYVSKDGLIIDWLPYGFCLFLIFLVGILMWERF